MDVPRLSKTVSPSTPSQEASTPVVLDQKFVHRSGSFGRVRRYLKGIHPSRGTILYGYSGWETLEEVDVILPRHSFFVAEVSHESCSVVG